MNSFFETTHYFSSYSAEHLLLLAGFILFCIAIIKYLKDKSESLQRKVMLGLALLFSITQLLKIPINLYIGIFNPLQDIPLHMCNFLPFILVWVYLKKSRTVWAVIFFWIVLGVSQANLTPSVEFSLFHYDAIRYWMVHLGLVLLALYPSIAWGWELELKDVGRTILWLNVTAGIIYVLNLALSSNYLYVMGKPEGTTFYSILPDWPEYILVLEGILLLWSLMVWGIFRLIKRQTMEEVVSVSQPANE